MNKLKVGKRWYGIKQVRENNVSLTIVNGASSPWLYWYFLFNPESSYSNKIWNSG